MNNLRHKGFTTVEAGLIIAVVLIIAAAGYFTFSQVRNKDESKPAASSQRQTDAQTETGAEATVPEVKDEAGLDDALKTLDEADIDAGAVADTELETEAGAF